MEQMQLGQRRDARCPSHSKRRREHCSAQPSCVLPHRVCQALFLLRPAHLSGEARPAALHCSRCAAPCDPATCCLPCSVLP